MNEKYPRLKGEGIMVPIFKGGDTNQASTNWGIILINILGKIYSQILLNRLNKWAEKQETLIDNQFGSKRTNPLLMVSLLSSLLLLKKLAVRRNCIVCLSSMRSRYLAKTFGRTDQQ